MKLLHLLGGTLLQLGATMAQLACVTPLSTEQPETRPQPNEC